jgi:hypothetical protein
MQDNYCMMTNLDHFDDNYTGDCGKGLLDLAEGGFYQIKSSPSADAGRERIGNRNFHRVNAFIAIFSCIYTAASFMLAAGVDTLHLFQNDLPRICLIEMTIVALSATFLAFCPESEQDRVHLFSNGFSFLVFIATSLYVHVHGALPFYTLLLFYPCVALLVLLSTLLLILDPDVLSSAASVLEVSLRSFSVFLIAVLLCIALALIVGRGFLIYTPLLNILRAIFCVSLFVNFKKHKEKPSLSGKLRLFISLVSSLVLTEHASALMIHLVRALSYLDGDRLSSYPALLSVLAFFTALAVLFCRKPKRPEKGRDVLAVHKLLAWTFMVCVVVVAFCQTFFLVYPCFN